jgi:DNA-binding response OmpR family regulator
MSDQKTVLVVGQNLFFLPRIQNAATPQGYNVLQTRTDADFRDSFQEDTTALVLVDLEGNPDEWPKVVQGLRGEDKASVKVIAFGPHSDEAGMAKARELGCDLVISKGEFSRDMVKILAEAVDAGRG